MPGGAILVAFTEAIVRAEQEDGDRLRRTLVEELGAAAAGHAAATISAFSGLVRVADGTGIPIDDGLAAVSVESRAELGLKDFAGAANSRLDTVEGRRFSTIDALFDNRADR